jgi:ribosomal protein S18 acetylase RimI-like enzyme
MVLDYKIIPAGSCFIKDIKKIDDECFSKYPNENYSIDLIDFIVNQSMSFVAVINKEVIGFILINTDNIDDDCDDNTLFDLFNNNGITEFTLIYSLGVSLKYRNCGIASALLTHVFNYLKQNNISSLYLQVRESNTCALNLYKKNDFIQIEKLENYYCEPDEDGLFMVKYL